MGSLSGREEEPPAPRSWLRAGGPWLSLEPLAYGCLTPGSASFLMWRFFSLCSCVPLHLGPTLPERDLVLGYNCEDPAST